MSRYDEDDRMWPQSLLLALAIYAAIVVGGLLFLASEGWGWQDLAKLSGLQQAVAVLLLAPLAFLLYLLAQAAGEFVLSALAMATFKIVTLGQIGFGDAHLNYRFGLARDYNGNLVASESFVIGTAMLCWIAIGLAAYRWRPF